MELLAGLCSDELRFCQPIATPPITLSVCPATLLPYLKAQQAPYKLPTLPNVEAYKKMASYAALVAIPGILTT